MSNIKQLVKHKYSDIALEKGSGCSCSSKRISKEIGYTEEELQSVGAANMGLGCGNPIAFSKIKTGDTVVDLGSGGGIDCFLAATKTGPTGRVIGIDFSKEMVTVAKANAEKGGFNGIEFRLGDIEQLPIEDNSVDIVISNCVINLAPDKQKVFNEVPRVLKPGGALCVSDIVLLQELTPEQREDEGLIAGCVGGALLKNEYINIVKRTGLQVSVLSENKEISKQQYQGVPLESLMLEAIK